MLISVNGVGQLSFLNLGKTITHLEFKLKIWWGGGGGEGSNSSKQVRNGNELGSGWVF